MKNLSQHRGLGRLRTRSGDSALPDGGRQQAEIELKVAFWLPDLRLAGRVVSQARAILRDHQVRDDYWFDVTAGKASDALIMASESCHIPLLTNQEYRRICVSFAKRRETKIENLMRRVGMQIR